MTPSEFIETKRSVLDERIAIMVENGMSEEQARDEAEKCWNKYMVSVRNGEWPPK